MSEYSTKHPDFPASAKRQFSSFKAAYEWATTSERFDFTAPSVSIGQEHASMIPHQYRAWQFHWAVLTIIKKGWSLLAIPSADMQKPRASALCYDKEKDWLIAVNSDDNFNTVDPDMFNSGIKVCDNPAKSMTDSLGELPEEPPDIVLFTAENTPLLKNWPLNKWYDGDGDYLYGDDYGGIKSTLKFFADDLGEDVEVYFVDVKLPTDDSIKAINWFFRGFAPK